MVIWSGFLAPKHFPKEAPHHFANSTCPQVWAQKVWEWSDVYSRRIGPKKVALNQVSVVPAGVLRVISDGFLAPYFEGGPPPFSESKCPQVWAQKVWEWSDVYSRRMDRRWHCQVSEVPAGVLRVISCGTHTFFESTCPVLYAQQSWNDQPWRNDL